VIFVDARHLNYQGGRSFFTSLAKHPSDWSKNGDVGHVWIALFGQGKKIIGGQTGEREGLTYTQGVLKGLIKDNPISLLQKTRYDGMFEKGSGGHSPTFAAKFNLTAEQFQSALRYIQTYDFKRYKLTSRQCTTFATGVAAACGICLEETIDLYFPPFFKIGGEIYPLWKDSSFAKVKMATPDRLELSLKEKVLAGEAEYAVDFHPAKDIATLSKEALETVSRAPERIIRWWKTMDY
jgi:hypothetical protein